MTMEQIVQIVERFEEAKAQKAEREAEAKEAGARMRQHEAQLISALLDMAERAGLDDVSKVDVEVNGRKYGAKIATFYTIPAEHRVDAIQQLREMGYGDLVIERVDDRTLTKSWRPSARRTGASRTSSRTCRCARIKSPR